MKPHAYGSANLLRSFRDDARYRRDRSCLEAAITPFNSANADGLEIFIWVSQAFLRLSTAPSVTLLVANPNDSFALPPAPQLPAASIPVEISVQWKCWTF